MYTQNRSNWRSKLASRPLTIAFAACALTVTGCATMEQEQVTDVERLLAAAGFELKPADTPEKLEHLKSLPQLDVTGHKDGTESRFVYADATYCQCLYVGDHAAYQRYQDLARKSSRSDLQRQMTMLNHTSRMRWDVWGPYRGGP